MINEQNEIGKYIKLCFDKKIYHIQNAISANKMNNMFNFINVVLSAGTALSMTVLSVVEASDLNVSIIGGVFAFSIAVMNQVQKNYGFQILNYQHAEIANDYTELESEFTILSGKQHTYDDYEKLVLRYLSINNKTNITAVRHCGDFFCCL